MSPVKFSIRGPGSVPLRSTALCQGLKQSLLLLVCSERESIHENSLTQACLGQSLRPDRLGVNQYNVYFNQQKWEWVSTDAQISGGSRALFLPATTQMTKEYTCVHMHCVFKAGGPDKRQGQASNQFNSAQLSVVHTNTDTKP